MGGGSPGVLSLSTYDSIIASVIAVRLPETSRCVHWSLVSDGVYEAVGSMECIDVIAGGS